MSDLSRSGLAIISGPSGVGKSTVVKEIMSFNSSYNIVNNLQFGLSATTRKPRASDEQSIKKYRYVSRDDFRRLIRSNKLIEYAEYAGNYYGTLTPSPDSKTLLEIEVQGAAKIAAKMPAFLIFLTAPGDNDTERMAVIENRLRMRENSASEAITARLYQAQVELTQGPAQSHLVIVNYNPKSAAQEILGALYTYFNQAHA